MLIGHQEGLFPEFFADLSPAYFAGAETEPFTGVKSAKTTVTGRMEPALSSLGGVRFTQRPGGRIDRNRAGRTTGLLNTLSPSVLYGIMTPISSVPAAVSPVSG